MGRPPDPTVAVAAAVNASSSATAAPNVTAVSAPTSQQPAVLVAAVEVPDTQPPDVVVDPPHRSDHGDRATPRNVDVEPAGPGDDGTTPTTSTAAPKRPRIKKGSRVYTTKGEIFHKNLSGEQQASFPERSQRSYRVYGEVTGGSSGVGWDVKWDTFPIGHRVQKAVMRSRLHLVAGGEEKPGPQGAGDDDDVAEGNDDDTYVEPVRACPLRCRRPAAVHPLPSPAAHCPCSTVCVCVRVVCVVRVLCVCVCCACVCFVMLH